MPISAQTTLGIKNAVPKEVAPWNTAPSLLDYLDSMQTLERKVNAPFMMPIAAKYRDLGTMIEGKIESGVIKKDVKYLMMPNNVETTIAALYGETEDEIPAATCGDQVRLRIKGVEEEDILPGFVLCSPRRPVHNVSSFEAQIVLLDLKSILSAGFNCVLHVHSATEEVTFAALLHKLEKGTGRKSKKAPGFATKGMSIIARLEVQGGAGSVCVERFEDYPQLGRFTLRDQVCFSLSFGLPFRPFFPSLHDLGKLGSLFWLSRYKRMLTMTFHVGSNHCHWQDHEVDHGCGTDHRWWCPRGLNDLERMDGHGSDDEDIRSVVQEETRRATP